MVLLVALFSALASDHVVAVAPFSAHGSDPALAAFAAGLPDMLTTDLAVPDVAIVERTRLDAIVAELRLQQSDWADPATAVRVGRGVGATVIVVGAMSEAGGTVRLDARLVDVETGLVRLAVEKEGSASDVFQLERSLALAVLDQLGVAVAPEHRARLGAIGAKPGDVGAGFDPEGAPVTLVQKSILMPWGVLVVDGAPVQKLVKKVPMTVGVRPGVHEVALATDEKAGALRCLGVIDVPPAGLSMTTRELCDALRPGVGPYGTVVRGGILVISEPIDTTFRVEVDGRNPAAEMLNVNPGLYTLTGHVRTPGQAGSVEVCRLAVPVRQGGRTLAAMSPAGCTWSEL